MFAVGVIIGNLALVRRITIVIHEQFFALLNQPQRTEENFFGGINEVIAHIWRVGVVIQTAVTQYQRTVGFCPFKSIAIDDGVFEGCVVSMVDQN